MSEEEIIKECTELAQNEHHELANCWDEEYSSKAIQAILDLYKAEKEKNEQLQDEKMEILLSGMKIEKFCWKDKIKAKMKKYEWAIEHYDCDEADYRQSQDLGSWHVLQELLESEEQ